MPLPPDAAGRAAQIGLNLGGRVLGLTKLVVTVNDHLDRLDRADVRLEERLDRLAVQVATLSGLVSGVSGQLTSIEKRLDDKDRLVVKTIELEMMRAVEKLRLERDG